MDKKGEALSKAGIVKRTMVLVAGLGIMAYGVAFSIIGALGTSPISSLPYVTSLMSGLTVGQTTIILHIVLISLQIAILRKKYKAVQLLQLPVALVFGYLTDFALESISAIEYSGYGWQWLYCAIGIVLVGIGVSFEVTARLIVLAGEGFVIALCKVTDWPFPRVKVGFDTSLVLISIVLSLVFLGQLEGVREGTVAAAFCVGIIAKYVNIPMKKFEERFLN